MSPVAGGNTSAIAPPRRARRFTLQAQDGPKLTPSPANSGPSHSNWTRSSLAVTSMSLARQVTSAREKWFK
jgi:hypothetical protein